MDKEFVERLFRRYAQVTIKADVSGLDNPRKEVIKALIEAGKGVEEIFWHQTSPHALEYLKKYENATDETGQKLYKLIYINGGPYDRLSHFTPFDGAPARPKGGGFYPENVTAQEVREAGNRDPKILSPYTMVVRKDGELKAEFYHDYFKEQTERIVEGLRKAAGFAQDRSLRTYLIQRALDLQRDDYYASDCDWIDLKDPFIDVVIGPYEVYEDELLGIKAAHEAVVMIRLPQAQAVVDAVERDLGEVAQYVWPEGGKEIGAAPISVVDSVFRAGDAAVGYQFVAFNLPNDPKVRKEKGAKKVLHRNFLNARLERIIEPVGEALMVPERAKGISYDGLFYFVLMHENCHSMGPQYVRGSQTPVGNALLEQYVAIEEAKADTSGMASAKFLMDKGVLPVEKLDQLVSTFVAAQLRAIRFQGEAHAVAAQISLSWLYDKGLLKVKDSKFDMDIEGVPQSLKELSEVLMEIQAEGDRAKAEAFVKEYGTTKGPFAEAVARVQHLPVELMPELEVKGLL